MNISRRTIIKALAASITLRIPLRRAHALDEKIIIIGAGMAGISAARDLIEQGKEVLVLEARERIGGRIFTDSTLGVPVDLGGAWIEGEEENPLIQLVEELNIRTVLDDEAVPVYDRAGEEYDQQAITELQTIINRALRKVESEVEEMEYDKAFGKLLEQQLEAKRDELDKHERDLLNWLLTSTFVEDHAVELSKLSALSMLTDGGFDGPSRLMPDGYLSLLKGLARNVDIRLGTKVERIAYSPKGVTVSAGSKTFHADKVLVTVPLGYLKRNFIQFSPELPDSKQRAISRLEMGLLNKVALRFPKVFWQEDEQISGLGIIPHQVGALKEFGTFANLSRVVGEPVLVGYLGGDLAEASETLSLDELTKLAMAPLRRVFGNTIPDPTNAVRTKWRSDPFTFGSYSYQPVGVSATERDELARPILNRVFFAGEATNKLYSATVHGAHLSGRRAAREMAAA